MRRFSVCRSAPPIAAASRLRPWNADELDLKKKNLFLSSLR
ncbi:MAG TPA: hypothetical protein VM534_00300 [Thermoanaerobaculia bacterium]|nr:hypothetical protein [Thermoanaerobaculia bacterium]